MAEIKKKLISTVLQRVSDEPKKSEKIRILQENNCLALRDILKGNFDSTIQFLLPEGDAPIDNVDKKKYGSIGLFQETKKFKYFIKGFGDNINTVKREQMYIDILNRVHDEEIAMLNAMKDKKLQENYPGITKKLVMEAFPGLIEK